MSDLDNTADEGRARKLVEPTPERILLDVARERFRQEAMKAEGRFTYTCADAEMTNPERFTVLGEEVGEVAREALTQDGHRLARDTEGTPYALRTELVQVAAVAIAWVEAIDREHGPFSDDPVPPMFFDRRKRAPDA